MRLSAFLPVISIWPNHQSRRHLWRSMSRRPSSSWSSAHCTESNDRRRQPLDTKKTSLTSSLVVTLRNATIEDLALLRSWEEKPHLREASVMGDADYNDWNWEHELTLRPSWRYQLIATVKQKKEVNDAQEESLPIGFLQIIDPLRENGHYWDNYFSESDRAGDTNWRAIDTWIGEEEYLGRGCGRQMMERALELCFAAEDVTGVLVDPMYDNTAAHGFYQRLGFKPVREHYFGPDRCLVHCFDRTDYHKDAA